MNRAGAYHHVIRQFFTLLAILTLLLCVDAWAAPAAPMKLTLFQPDGTSFTAIPRGDEFANWTETADGHTIVKVGDTWYYAERNDAGELRATGDKVGSLSPAELQAIPLHLSPQRDPEAFLPSVIRKIPRYEIDGRSGETLPLTVSHTQNVLTVLVDYSDITFTYSDASFQSLIYGASNSVRDFFLDDSYGGFTITAANENYGTSNDGIIHVTRATNHPNQADSFSLSRPEARAIVNLTDSFIDYSAYDTNGDNVVSAEELSIVIILAGYETSFGGVANALTPNVWGHKSSFDSNLILDGMTLSPYTMFGEGHGTVMGSPHQATIGIMCHELGHLMLGLPDLYDTDNSSRGIGRWGLMGGGSWNAVGAFSGDSPSHMSAWSKAATDFSVPTLIDTNQAGVNIAQAETNEDSKLLWIDKYRWKEYFLVENRQLSGYDAGLPGDGLLIWHIDEFKTSNSDETHKWVDLEAADGQLDMDLDVNGGDAGDPFPGTSNNTTFDDTSTPNSKDYNGNATLISVSGISASGPNMTANMDVISGEVGDHVRYDENGFNNAVGFGTTTAWMGVNVLNDTAFSNIDGIDVYIVDNVGATIDVSLYSSMAGGTPSGQIYSQTGFAAVRGWNRLLFTTPQSFPMGAERGIVIKVVNNSSTFPLVVDTFGVESGRSYFSTTGMGTFTPMCAVPILCGDVNIVALLSDTDVTAPTATTITPSETGPTNADSVDFDIIFSEEVVNFNEAADVVIAHTGTAHSGVTITGSGASYSAQVTGISGDGSYTLTVDTGSDVEDMAGNPLASSVTSAAVFIDNTAPMVSIGDPSVASTQTGPVSYNISYTGADAVTLVPGDITLNKTGTANGTVGVSGSGSAARTVTISGISGAGTLGISIDAGTATDTAGNSASAAGPSATFSVDNDVTAPTATAITPTETGPTNTDSVDFDISFSEAVVNFNDAADVVIAHTGTAHSGVTITGSGASYTAQVTGISGDGSFTLTVDTGSDVEDMAGNPLASSVTSAAVLIDNIAPMISIGAPSVASTQTGPVSYIITYTGADAVTLAPGDITLNQTDTATGTIGVSGSGSAMRTVTISGISGTGTLGISIDAGTATDTAGNSAGAAGPSTTFSVGSVDLIFEHSFESPP